MSNDYFEHTSTLSAGAIAKASDINAIFDSVEAGFDVLPGEDETKLGTIQYGIDSGTANAYAVALTHTVTDYTDGMIVSFKPLYSNTTTTPSLNVDSVGAKTITLQDGTAVVAGDIQANYITTVRYNATNDTWEVQNVTKSMIALISAVSSLSAEGGALASDTDILIGSLWTKLVPGVQSNVTAFTADDTLVAADLVSVKRTLNNGGGNENITIGAQIPILTNTGATAAVDLDLPAGASGMWYIHFNAAAYSFTQTANGTETFRWGSNQSSAGGSIGASTVGTVYLVFWGGAEWIVVPLVGSITVT